MYNLRESLNFASSLLSAIFSETKALLIALGACAQGLARQSKREMDGLLNWKDSLSQNYLHRSEEWWPEVSRELWFSGYDPLLVIFWHHYFNFACFYSAYFTDVSGLKATEGRRLFNAAEKPLEGRELEWKPCKRSIQVCFSCFKVRVRISSNFLRLKLVLFVMLLSWSISFVKFSLLNLFTTYYLFKGPSSKDHPDPPRGLKKKALCDPPPPLTRAEKLHIRQLESKVHKTVNFCV